MHNWEEPVPIQQTMCEHLWQLLLQVPEWLWSEIRQWKIWLCRWVYKVFFKVKRLLLMRLMKVQAVSSWLQILMSVRMKPTSAANMLPVWTLMDPTGVGANLVSEAMALNALVRQYFKTITFMHTSQTAQKQVRSRRMRASPDQSSQSDWSEVVLQLHISFRLFNHQQAGTQPRLVSCFWSWLDVKDFKRLGLKTHLCKYETLL